MSGLLDCRLEVEPVHHTLLGQDEVGEGLRVDDVRHSLKDGLCPLDEHSPDRRCSVLLSSFLAGPLHLRIRQHALSEHILHIFLEISKLGEAPVDQELQVREQCLHIQIRWIAEALRREVVQQVHIILHFHHIWKLYLGLVGHLRILLFQKSKCGIQGRVRLDGHDR